MGERNKPCDWSVVWVTWLVGDIFDWLSSLAQDQRPLPDWSLYDYVIYVAVHDWCFSVMWSVEGQPHWLIKGKEHSSKQVTSKVTERGKNMMHLQRESQINLGVCPLQGYPAADTTLITLALYCALQLVSICHLWKMHYPKEAAHQCRLSSNRCWWPTVIWYKIKWRQLIQHINNLSITKNIHDGSLDRPSGKYQVGFQAL